VTALSEILTEQVASGVYVVEGPAIHTGLEQLARKHGLVLFVLDGRKTRSKDEFLDNAAAVLGFPDYFGRNWDAFADCLTDMSWAQGNGFLVAYAECHEFAKRSPDEFDTAIEIFKEAAEIWKKEGITFLVILLGTEGLELGLRSIEF
jgi:RNAse (barnase) inhibitor barstar